MAPASTAESFQFMIAIRTSSDVIVLAPLPTEAVARGVSVIDPIKSHTVPLANHMSAGLCCPRKSGG